MGSSPGDMEETHEGSSSPGWGAARWHDVGEHSRHSGSNACSSRNPSTTRHPDGITNSRNVDCFGSLIVETPAWVPFGTNNFDVSWITSLPA